MLESDFFKRSRPDFRKLKAFGFQLASGSNDNRHTYTYSEELPDGQFRAELSVSEDGSITGRVIDLETNEEYLPIRVENQIGGFSGNVREMYLEFLAKIDRACFVPVHFMFDQANRTEAWISREYGVDVEFPWEKYPGNGTFKCSENSKWFKQFKKAKMTDEIIELINDTKSPYCLCCIAEFLEEQAKLIDSKDPTEHFDGFIAQTNIKVCLYKLRRLEREQQWSLQEN